MQETIEKVLSEVQGVPTKVVGCGRTDAGVHAADYYLHFNAERPLREKWVYIMNRRLPDDIVFHAVYPVASNAHVRYDATERSYEYRIHTQPDPFIAPVSSYYPLENFAEKRVAAALEILVTTKDFRALCITPDRHNTTVCDLREASLHPEDGGKWRFRFVADRFLRGMIRLTVHQLLEIGEGRLTTDDFRSALESGERLSAKQAWPEGLFLSAVTYPNH